MCIYEEVLIIGIYMNKKKKELFIITIIALIFLAIFVAISVIVYNNAGDLSIDNKVRDYIYDIRGEKYGFLYYLFRILTEFGYLYFVIGVGVIGLIITKVDRYSLLFIFGYVLSCTLNVVIKMIFNRDRPMEINQWVVDKESSFPSGHSNSAGFVLSFIIYYVFKRFNKKSVKYSCLGVGVLLILAVMLSRLVLGMHYLTDVIAGASLGVVAFAITAYICVIFERYDIASVGLLDFKGRKNEEDSINS